MQKEIVSYDKSSIKSSPMIKAPYQCIVLFVKRIKHSLLEQLHRLFFFFLFLFFFFCRTQLSSTSQKIAYFNKTIKSFICAWRASLWTFHVFLVQIYLLDRDSSNHIVHFLSSFPTFSIWAASWQNQQNDCAPSEDSDQPGHPLRTQAFFMRKAKTLIRLGGCPGWSESSLGAQATLFVLSCRGSFVTLSAFLLSCSSKTVRWCVACKSLRRIPAPRDNSFFFCPLSELFHNRRDSNLRITRGSDSLYLLFAGWTLPGRSLKSLLGSGATDTHTVVHKTWT